MIFLFQTYNFDIGVWVFFICEALPNFISTKMLFWTYIIGVYHLVNLMWFRAVCLSVSLGNGGAKHQHLPKQRFDLPAAADSGGCAYNRG